MLKSVYQNGGFYIGKYETGIEGGPRIKYSSNTTQIPVIKQTAYPYNYVTCSQAQTLASNMEPGNYTTSLMFGVQWDLALKYLETNGISKRYLKSDSTSLGNYSNNNWNIINENLKYAPNGSGWVEAVEKIKDSVTGVLLSTGASDSFSKQGIYDLAGNVWEWTFEYTSDKNNPCTVRGGTFSSVGMGDPIASRTKLNSKDAGDRWGLRITLY